MIRIAICESSARLMGEMETAIAELGTLLPGAVEYECYTCGSDLRGGLARGEAYQAIYMNMELSDTDGIALATQLRAEYPRMEFLLVYLSDRSSFNRLVFGTRPFDILPIPLAPDSFIRSLIAVTEFLQNDTDLFICKKGRTVYQVKKSEIICLESAGRDIVVSTADREALRYPGAIKNELAHFREIAFVHPHQAFIVNLHYVSEYRARELVLDGDKQVPISELRLKEVRQEVLRFWEYNRLR